MNNYVNTTLDEGTPSSPQTHYNKFVITFVVVVVVVTVVVQCLDSPVLYLCTSCLFVKYGSFLSSMFFFVCFFPQVCFFFVKYVFWLLFLVGHVPKVLSLIVIFEGQR